MDDKKSQLSGSVVHMSVGDFFYYVRQAPHVFWAACKKTCHCELGDLRLQGDVCECGCCGSKIRYR